MVEEFFNFEKMRSDFVKFLTRLFDNTKTNLYKDIIQKYETMSGKNFFDFFFKGYNRYSYAYDFMKRKKNMLSFIKILMDSSNETVIHAFGEYFQKNILKFSIEAEKTQSKMNSSGNFRVLYKLKKYNFNNRRDLDTYKFDQI